MISRTRIGFVIAEENAQWMGGKNYLINLLKSVSDLPDRRIETVLFVSPELDDSFINQFPVDVIVRTRMVKPRGLRRMLGMVGLRVLGRNFALKWLARRHRINRFSHIAPAGRFSPIKVMTWIPDFQHVRLPGFFSDVECARRDLAYAVAARDAFRIILSSHAAKADFISIHSEAAEKARVVQFVSNVGGTTVPTPLADLEQKYDLAEGYFHIPNQLWKHKNHRVVIDALALLRAQGHAATLVFTGDTHDFRHPDFFDETQRHIAAKGVGDGIRILGLVSYADVIGLMRNAIAIINPSLFEGWSTTVEEAKSLGKQIILSDIPVHREQAPLRGLFFSPDDPVALASLIRNVQINQDPVEDRRYAETAAAELLRRFKAFGEIFERICLD